MTITFSMRNVTSDSVHMVMLRKFFQMVFVGTDHKSLRIYTATVLGASENNSDTNFISNLEELRDFRMCFEFAVGQMDSNDVCSIEHQDITDDDSNQCFLQQIGCIQNVWGTECKVIVNDQSALSQKLALLTDYNQKDIQNRTELTKATARLSGKKVLWTEQCKRNGIDEKFFQSLSVHGAFEAAKEAQAKKDRDELAKRSEYIIKVPQDTDLPPGIELVNWVRTTITFAYELDDTDLNYIIRKEPYDFSKTNQRCRYLAPDFTWYFSPAVKSFIDSRNCLVELKRERAEVIEEQVCPLHLVQFPITHNDKFNNSISSVPNKLTVNFDYWINDEKINNRQKYRLITKDIFRRPEDFSNLSEIGIFLDLYDEHNRGNRQFILGIFLSFALSFGIDSTRLKEIDYCFWPLNKLLTGDVWWIIFLILCTFTWLTKPPKLEVTARKLRRSQQRLMMISFLWMVWVFAILRAPLIAPFIGRYRLIIGHLTGIGLIFICWRHIKYIRKPKVNLEVSVLKDLFRGEIL